MHNGISLYLGLDNTFSENIALLNLAHKYHIKRVFTSLHIPETNVITLQNELQEILYLAQSYDMEVISDVSPNTLKLLNLPALDPDKLHRLGIDTIRLDFGYSPEEIAHLSHSQLKMQFNASTITADFLHKLQAYDTDFTHIDALHNFYPREGTGLAISTFKRQNKLLRKYNIPVGAFIPSYNRPRSPMNKGLPTLECHRYQKADFAMRHLTLLGVNSIFIGDSLPTEKEIKALSEISTDFITLKAKCLTHDKFVQDLLTDTIFTARIDAAKTAIRTQESRNLCKSYQINPEYIASRKIGAITIDNLNYARYMGELQIITQEQNCDHKVNTIAQIIDSDLTLLDFIQPNSKFKIELI